MSNRQIALVLSLSVGLAMFSACARNPLDDVTLPQLCPSSMATKEVTDMVAIVRGQKRNVVVRKFGTPERHERDASTNIESLFWGPLLVADYQRFDGLAISVNCEIEMHVAADDTIVHVLWKLVPVGVYDEGK